MEQVTVRTYRESGFPMRYGSDYVRPNGERIQIATGLVSESNARFEVTRILTECQWEPFDPDRQDGIIEMGKAWIDTQM
jgi:hypothetical protein